jgi:hypothetical protein
MRVWTRAVFDMETLQLVAGDWEEYDGPVAECKGANVAQQQQQQELAMQQKAYDTQAAQLQQLQTQLTPYLQGAGQGYDPQQMAGMQSQFLNQNAQQFQNAGQAVRAALLARGEGSGTAPVGGDYTRGISSLMGAAGASQAQGLLGLQQQSALQALQNKFNAAGVLSGNAQTLTGTQGVAGSGASSALNSYIQAKNSGLMQNLMSGLGSGLGQGLGAMATGGLSTMLSGLGKGGGSAMNLGTPSYMPITSASMQPIAPTSYSGIMGTVPGTSGGMGPMPGF